VSDNVSSLCLFSILDLKIQNRKNDHHLNDFLYVSSYAIRYFDLDLDCGFVKDISQFTSFFGGNEVEISLSTSLLHRHAAMVKNLGGHIVLGGDNVPPWLR
jgi:hypothetical protein